MNKKVLVLSALVILGAVGSSMPAHAGYIKPNAVIYDNSTVPLAPYANSQVQPLKKGSATCTSYLWIYTKGQCGIQDAMKAGNITKFWGADKTTKSYAGLYMKVTTDVYGE